MKSNFFKPKEDKKEDIINKFFRMENLKNDTDIEENYFALKRKLLLYLDSKKDNLTIQLILNLYLYNTNILTKNEQIIRIIKNELFIILKNHDTFRYFFYNNHINDKILLKIIQHLKYEHFIKNKIINKEGEDSLKMFFVLKGNVSVMKGSNKLNIIKQNENFGQWDVIYHRKRKVSYISLDDCHIISIDKEIIRKYLQDKLIKGEDEYKSFATKFLKKNGITIIFRIERIINNMKILHFRKEEIIYNEGDQDKNVYLIYKGEAKLLKKITDGEFNFVENLREDILKIQEKAKNLNYKDLISDEDIKSKNNNNNNFQNKLMENPEYKTLLILGKGSIGGSEISTGIVNKKYTLVANSDYTTILKIELKYIKENINQFLISLLPIFIQTEKEIHARFKQIKSIDKLMPENCQIFKYKNFDNDENSLSLLDNNKEFINEIKKINQKFDVNEGGFIKMNDFNFHLNCKKNKLKEQLMEIKKKNIKINNLIKQYDKKEEIKERYKGVKMNKRFYTMNVNKGEYNNLIESNGVQGKEKFFITEKRNKNINLIKNRSAKYFAKKTMENFDKIIENYRKRKEFFIIDIYNPQIINKEKKDENRKISEQPSIKGNQLLKEIIIINKKDYIREYKDKNKYRIKSGKIRRNNNNNIFKRSLNVFKTMDNKEEKICLTNNNILRKLFEKNMIKNRRKKSLDFKFSEKRMIYYNTGMYDMPFVTNFNMKSNQLSQI